MPRRPPNYRTASFADLNARTLHDLLKLRIDVFVVEQNCPYPELDGRDVEPGTRHVWLTDGGAPLRTCGFWPTRTASPGSVGSWWPRRRVAADTPAG